MTATAVERGGPSVPPYRKVDTEDVMNFIALKAMPQLSTLNPHSNSAAGPLHSSRAYQSLWSRAIPSVQAPLHISQLRSGIILYGFEWYFYSSTRHHPLDRTTSTSLGTLPAATATNGSGKGTSTQPHSFKEGVIVSQYSTPGVNLGSPTSTPGFKPRPTEVVAAETLKGLLAQAFEQLDRPTDPRSWERIESLMDEASHVAHVAEEVLRYRQERRPSPPAILHTESGHVILNHDLAVWLRGLAGGGR